MPAPLVSQSGIPLLVTACSGQRLAVWKKGCNPYSDESPFPCSTPIEARVSSFSIYQILRALNLVSIP
jgi:hypothetical protein